MALPYVTESQANMISKEVTKEVIIKEINSDNSKLKEELKEFIDQEIEEQGGGSGTPLVTLNVSWNEALGKHELHSDTTAEQIDALIAENKIPTLIVKNQDNEKFVRVDVDGNEATLIHNAVGQFAGPYPETDTETGDIDLLGYEFDIISLFKQCILRVILKYNHDDVDLSIYPLEFE